MRLFASVVLFVLLAIGIQTALALPDDIYLTIPPGGDRYITLQLPDDSGWAGRGEVEYTITMQPSPQRTWSDFSEQIVRTDENNTVQIPIYFRKKTNSSCGEPFRLAISAPSVGAGRVISGGACESAFAGVSAAPAATGQSAGSSLNQNFGLFDIAFTEQSYYVQPDGIANIAVLAASNQDGASIHVTLAAGGGPAAEAARSGLAAEAVGFGVSPAAHDISFGYAGGQRQLQFQVQAPNSSGAYDLALAGSMAGCSAQGCSMAKHASLVVGGSPPAKGGFSAQLFPTAITTDKGRPVAFRLTIYNNEATGSFNASMQQVYGIETDFRDASLMVGGGSQQSIDFNVTPTGMLSSYEFSISVRSADNEKAKIIAGYVNVNGMDAGAQRGLEMVQATGNQTAIAQASQAYGSFQSSPSLDSYGSLQDELDRLARQPAPAQNASNGTARPAVPYQNYTPPPAASQSSGLDLLGKDMWILLVVVGLCFVASVVFYMKRGRGSKGLKKEFKYGEEVLPE